MPCLSARVLSIPNIIGFPASGLFQNIAHPSATDLDFTITTFGATPNECEAVCPAVAFPV